MSWRGTARGQYGGSCYLAWLASSLVDARPGPISLTNRHYLLVAFVWDAPYPRCGGRFFMNLLPLSWIHDVTSVLR
jgi:hypothetical protein